MLWPVPGSASRRSSSRYLCARSSAKWTRCSIATGADVGLHVDAHRLARELGREAADGAVEGRGEQHRLPRRRRLRADALDVLVEAHVEHPVGLVEDEDLELREVDALALDVIHQPARRGDQQVDAALELADLRRIRRAAEQAHGAQAQLLPVAYGLRGHLLRELARRCQHEDAGDAGAALARTRGHGLRRQLLERGQHESGRFARASLRRRDHVAAGEERRDGLRLDVGRGGVAAGRERLQQLRREIQRFESHVLVQKEWHRRPRSRRWPCRCGEGHAASFPPREPGAQKIRNGGCAKVHSRCVRGRVDVTKTPSSLTGSRVGREARSSGHEKNRVREIRNR